MRSLATLVALYCLWQCSLAVARLDSEHPNMDIRTIGFGSCSKTLKSQDYWYNIADHKPDLFVWGGDIVYGKTKRCTSLKKINSNYKKLKRSEAYQSFLNSNPDLIVEGVYDDHDMGCNDGWKTTKVKRKAQQLLLDFLDVSSTDPRRSRDGVYSAHMFGGDDNTANQILLIMLDARSHSDGTVIPSVAWTEVPLSSFVASFMRWISAFFGIVDNYHGSIIDDAQWVWLQSILSQYATNADIVILQSSVQVLTSNPYFESWGHYPRSKKRLLSMLHRYIDSNLVIISGDVHHSSFIGGDLQSDGPLEITSSSLTHGLDESWHSAVARRIITTYNDHFSTPENVPLSMTAENNFGILRVSRDGNVNVSIHHSYDNQLLISADMNRDVSVVKDLLKHQMIPPKMRFPVKYPLFGFEFVVMAAPLIAVMVVIVAISWLIFWVIAPAPKQHVL